MCVIIVGEKKKFSKELIRNAMFCNPDGAGVMWACDNTVHIRKGFFNHKEAWDVINEIEPNQTIVFHARLATSGLVDAGNCHPFPITNSIKSLRSPSIECDVAMCHNGIINNMSSIHLSDTQVFVKDMLYPLRSIMFEKPVVNLIEMAIGTDRVVFLRDDGKMEMIGEFFERDGLKMSNLSPYGLRTIHSVGCAWCGGEAEYEVTDGRDTLLAKGAFICDNCKKYFDVETVRRIEYCVICGGAAEYKITKNNKQMLIHTGDFICSDCKKYLKIANTKPI